MILYVSCLNLKETSIFGQVNYYLLQHDHFISIKSPPCRTLPGATTVLLAELNVVDSFDFGNGPQFYFQDLLEDEYITHITF